MQRSTSHLLYERDGNIFYKCVLLLAVCEVFSATAGPELVHTGIVESVEIHFPNTAVHSGTRLTCHIRRRSTYVWWYADSATTRDRHRMWRIVSRCRMRSCNVASFCIRNHSTVYATKYIVFVSVLASAHNWSVCKVFWPLSHVLVCLVCALSGNYYVWFQLNFPQFPSSKLCESHTYTTSDMDLEFRVHGLTLFSFPKCRTTQFISRYNVYTKYGRLATQCVNVCIVWTGKAKEAPAFCPECLWSLLSPFVFTRGLSNWFLKSSVLQAENGKTGHYLSNQKTKTTTRQQERNVNRRCLGALKYRKHV